MVKQWSSNGHSIVVLREFEDHWKDKWSFDGHSVVLTSPLNPLSIRRGDLWTRMVRSLSSFGTV